MSCKSSFSIFDEFENNKENIDPVTGLCSNVNPLNFSVSKSTNKKRVPLRDITPVFKKTSKSNEVNSKVTFTPPVFNLIVNPPSTRTGTPIDSTIRSLR